MRPPPHHPPLKVGNYEEAAVQLAACVNDDDFVSPKGHSKHAMWMRLCDLCADHPNEVAKSLKVILAYFRKKMPIGVKED